jgi:hypothetical protein
MGAAVRAAAGAGAAGCRTARGPPIVAAVRRCRPAHSRSSPVGGYDGRTWPVPSSSYSLRGRARA